MEYKEVYTAEGSGGDVGHFGIKLLLSINRELNDSDKRVLRRKMAELEEEIEAETIRLSPKTVARNLKDRADIIACFPTPIFVEEIPNRYGPTNSYYRNFPWYQITTAKGRITIGWRKRVLEIDWGVSEITATAEELFHAEVVTKIGKLIHAWGYEKAKEYITKLLK